MKQNSIVNSRQKYDSVVKSTVFKSQSSKLDQEFSNTKNMSNVYDQGDTQRVQDLLKHQKNAIHFQNQCTEIQLTNSQDSKLTQFDQSNEQTFIQNIATPKFVEKKLVFGNQNEGIEQDFSSVTKNQRKISSAKRVQRNFIRSQLQQQQDTVMQNSYQVENANTKNLYEQTNKLIKNNKNQFFEIKDVVNQIQKQNSLERNNKNLILSNQENNQLCNILFNKGNLSYCNKKSFQNNQNTKLFNSEINNNQQISSHENSINKNQIIQLTKSSYSCDQEENGIASSNQTTKSRDQNMNQTNVLQQKPDLQKNQIQKKVRKINTKNQLNEEEQAKTDNLPQMNTSNEINDCNKLANMITLTNEFIFNKQVVKQSEKQDNLTSSNNNVSQLELKNQITNKAQQQIEKQSNNSVQNSKVFEDLNKFSFEKIKKNLFQDVVQQQKQIFNQNNSCKKLSGCHKNNSSEVFPQLFIIDSDQNFKQNQRLLENRSTTTSQLTKRQQILYLQGQLKKRNQLSLHEDYNNNKQNQPQQSQQQQQFLINPKKDTLKKYNMSQNIIEQQSGEPLSLQNLIQNTSFEKFESNYYSSKSQQLELEGSLNQQFISNQNEQLPKLYPTKVSYKSQKDRNFSLNYLKKQNLVQSQYQINSPTYTNSNIDNYSQILNPQTCNNFNQSNLSNNVDLNSMTKNLIPLNLIKGQIFSNFSHREKIQTSDTTPSSNQEPSKMNFQLLKYEQLLNQKNNESPQSFIKIEYDTNDS
ncbi:hypothetical protein ABPG74_011085 [Tetrahymena malaccensis]